MIICAAIKIKYLNSKKEECELVVCGHRHSDCFKVIHKLDNTHTISKIQGFINHKGEFLDREEAFKYVKEIGQCNATQRWYWEDHEQEELYSEDLY